MLSSVRTISPRVTGLSLSVQVGRGGQVVVFASSLPNVGIAALKPREDETSLYDTDRELSLYAPRDAIWKDIGDQCAEEGIGINLFLGMSKPIDIGTIGWWSLTDS